MSDIENVKARVMAQATELDNALRAVNEAQQVFERVSAEFMSAIENTALAEGAEALGSLDRMALDVLPSIQGEILGVQQTMNDLAARL